MLDQSILLRRPRRNRRLAAIRDLVAETHLLPSDLIAPFFLLPGEGRREPIPGLPGVERLSLDLLLPIACELAEAGVPGLLLFPVVPSDLKDPQGSFALDRSNFLLSSIGSLKRELPELLVMTDIALDPYTSHGHDGLVNGRGEVVNDATVAVLSEMALLHAASGVDFVAPSDMMDGRIGAIRRALDGEGFTDVGILAYTAKYASSLYQPFREILGSSLEFGDKKGYQMNPANIREALLEAELDEAEGADLLMVKPALFYLDVIAKMRSRSNLPICAYHVSGEYAMVMAAAQQGLLDPDAVFLEALTSIKRAGADAIISYAVPRIVSMLG
jgi:porphobilinogen synthase